MLTNSARESDKPFDIADDPNNDEDSSTKPVFDIITTVSETVKDRNRPMGYRPPPPPPNHRDSQSERDDGVNDPKTRKVQMTKMIVHSKHLINAFNAVIGSYSNINFLGETVTFEAPYYALINHRDSLSRYRMAQPACHDDEYATTTAKHIDVLLAFLESNYGDKIRVEEARYKRTPPSATSDWLWLLFKPGEVIYKELQNIWTPFVINNVSIDHDGDGNLRQYNIDCWDIRFSQGRMRRCTSRFTIQGFSGVQAICNLEVIPTAFFPEDLPKQGGLPMAEKQIAMGKAYWELVKRPAYKEYDGQSVDPCDMRTGRVSCTSRSFCASPRPPC